MFGSKDPSINDVPMDRWTPEEPARRNPHILPLLTASPVVRLNRAVAVGEADGPRAGVAALDPELPHHTAVRAYLLERAGDLEQAAALYAEASRSATNVPEATTSPSPATHPGCGSCCAPVPGCRLIHIGRLDCDGRLRSSLHGWSVLRRRRLLDRARFVWQCFSRPTPS